MASITSNASCNPSNISVSGKTTSSGTISWSMPSLPSNATITSRTLTGKSSSFTTGNKGATLTVNGTSVNSNSNFTIDLGTTSNVTSVSVSFAGQHKQSSTSVSFSNLVYTVEYEIIINYTVTFKDYDGTVLKTQTVEEGASATAPANPTRDGYNFTGWDVDFSNVTSNLTVTAQYEEIIYYTVTFKDYDGTVIKTQTVEEGASATAPSNPSRDGYNFTGWDKSFDNITSDLTVTAQYEEIVVYDIKVVKYKFDNSLDVIPLFNTDFTYTYEDIVEGNITTRTIYSNSLPTSMDMGSNSHKLTYVEYIDISNLTTLRYMFDNCLNLANINNLNNWDTKNITSMQNTFSNCDKLTTLDIKNWNVDNVTNMREMFYGMYNITELDLSNWNTSNVTTMNHMFSGCNNLVTINLGVFNMNKVTNTDGLFLNCTDLTSIIMNNSDYNSVNKVIEKLPTRTEAEPGTLDIIGIDDVSQIDLVTANSKYWNIISSTEEEPEEPDINELVQGDINEDGTFNDESNTTVRTKYIDISDKKIIQVKVLTENVNISACYLYNANKELVKVIEIPDGKKRMFGVNLQELIAQIIEDEGSDQ